MLTIVPGRLWRSLLVFPLLALWVGLLGASLLGAGLLATAAPVAAQDATDLEAEPVHPSGGGVIQ